MLDARRRLRARAGEVYVIASYLLVALVIFPLEVNSFAYYALVVATLPVSLVAVTIQYLGGVLLFGLEQDGLLPRIAFFVLWVVLITLQMITIRTLVRALRHRP